MYKYVIRRMLLVIPVLLLSSLVVFGLMRVMPGDALTALMGESGNVGEKELAKLRKDLGLDRPYHEQYALWVWQMVSLNPGHSIFTNEPIAVSLKKAIPVTLRSEEHTSELQSQSNLVCRLLLEKKKYTHNNSQ